MYYAQIRHFDVANGPGIRTSIFVSGCTIRCKNCFNEAYQNFKFGNPWTMKETEQVIKYLSEETIAGLTVLGGEPFDNAKELSEILKIIRKSTKKSIWIYTGYLYENLMQDPMQKKLLLQADVLVDGPFIEAKKNLMLRFRGSENQRIIDVPKSIESNKVMLKKEAL